MPRQKKPKRTESEICAQWGPVVQEFNSTRTPEIIYGVRENGKGGGLSCNCPGWRFNRTCRHTEWVRENLQRVAAQEKEQCGDDEIAISADRLLNAIEDALDASWIDSTRDKLRKVIREFAALQLRGAVKDRTKKSWNVGFYSTVNARLITFDD